jgi:HEPN domain-containing protein
MTGPDDAQEWLRRARTNLKIARMSGVDLHLEELCFNAQQAAEKAIKGVLVDRRLTFPYTHDIRRLLVQLRKHGIEVPAGIEDARELTPFAFEFRYPSEVAVTDAQYRRALGIAEAVVRWAEQAIAASG